MELGDSNYLMQVSGGHLSVPSSTGTAPYIVPQVQWQRISSGPLTYSIRKDTIIYGIGRFEQFRQGSLFPVQNFFFHF